MLDLGISLRKRVGSKSPLYLVCASLEEVLYRDMWESGGSSLHCSAKMLTNLFINANYAK